MRKLWFVASLVCMALGLSACGGSSAPSVTHLSVTITGSGTAGAALSMTITAQDSAGNVVTSYMGTVTITSSDPQAQLPGPTPLLNGTATVQVILRTAGNQTIMVSDSGHKLSGSGSISVSPGQLAQLSVSSVPASTTAGTAFNFTVSAIDPFSNMVPSYGGTLHFTSSDAQAVLPADTKVQNGQGNFSITLKTAGGQTFTATDTANASLVASAGIGVNPGNMTQIVVSAPPAVTTNLAFMLTVSAEDAYGNIVPSYTGTVKFTSSDAMASLPGNSTLTNGTMTFSMTLVRLGPQTVTATDTVTNSLKGTTTAINVVTNAATHLSVTGPDASLARQAITVTVTALDAANNTSAGYAGTVHFTSSDAQAKLPGDSALATGTGTFSVTFETAATDTLTATDTTKSSITGMASVTVTTAAPLAISSGNPPDGTVGDRYNPHLVTFCIFGYCHHIKVYGFPLTATGGIPPYLWSFTPASMVPPGLAVASAQNSNCAMVFARPACIYGTPTKPGTYNVVLSVADSGVPAAPAATANYTINIAPPPPPIVNATPAPPPQGENVPYSFTFSASGYPPLTWSESGALPTGLMLDTNSGTLSGTPTQTGSFPIMMTATDQFNQKSAAVEFTIVITTHGFVATGNLNTARRFHTATLLNNGKVLIAGGEDVASNAFTSAELYDPSTGTFTPTAGNMTVARAGHTATLLGNGKVLITGGTSGGDSEAAVSSAELYDPIADRFTPTAAGLTAARVSHTATLLQSGKVLIAGGDVIFFNGIQNTGIMSLNSAEIFDPSTGMFTKTTGNMTVARESHTATLLNSGKVLLAGGSDGALGNTMPAVTIYARADLFDPSTGQFTPATGMLTAERDFLTANLLGSGKVLLAGGVNATTTLGTADLFDPSTQNFTATGDLVTPRFYHDASTLNDGNVLVTGGEAADGNTAAAEIYDPNAGTFGITGSMLHPRVWHTSTVLPNGKVLVTGGEDNTSALVAVAELYQ